MAGIAAKSVVGLGLMGLVAGTFAAPTVAGIELVASRRISRVVFEYDYRVVVKADPTQDYEGVGIELVSVPVGSRIVDGQADVGRVNAQATVRSGDVVTIAVDRQQVFKSSELAWKVTGTVAPPLAGNPASLAVSALVDKYDTNIPADGAVSVGADGARYSRTWIRATISTGATVGALNAALAAVGGRIVFSYPGGPAISISVQDRGSIEALDGIISQLEASPSLESVFRSPIGELDGIPASSGESSQGIENLAAVRAFPAWNARALLARILPCARPTVAVADVFGLGTPSPDLYAFNFLPSTRAPVTTGIGGGIAVPGASHHGYHVLGIIGGRYDNVEPFQGVTGMYPGSKDSYLDAVVENVGVRSFLQQVNAQSTDVPVPVTLESALRVMQGAAELPRCNDEHPFRNIVVNLSLNAPLGAAGDGIKYVRWFSSNFSARISRLAVGGTGSIPRVLLVVAAGNAKNGRPISSAATNAPWSDVSFTGAPVLKVENRRALINATGGYEPGCLHPTSFRNGDISAIGSVVDSAVNSYVHPNGSTGRYTGTSQAAPAVAGLAAYVWSLNPALTAEEVANLIKRQARSVPACANDPGAPVIDAYSTILAADPDGSVRHAVLDFFSDGTFTAGDARAAAERIAEAGGADIASQRQPKSDEWSRVDFNGDGLAGGSSTERFKLEPYFPKQGGARYPADYYNNFYTVPGQRFQATTHTYGIDFGPRRTLRSWGPAAVTESTRQPLHETELTDLDILCYFVNTRTLGITPDPFTTAGSAAHQAKIEAARAEFAAYTAQLNLGACGAPLVRSVQVNDAWTGASHQARLWKELTAAQVKAQLEALPSAICRQLFLTESAKNWRARVGAQVPMRWFAVADRQPGSDAGPKPSCAGLVAVTGLGDPANQRFLAAFAPAVGSAGQGLYFDSGVGRDDFAFRTLEFHDVAADGFFRLNSTARSPTGELVVWAVAP